VDQVYVYLRLALYWGLLASCAVCYLILLGHLLWNKQWLIVFISIFFTVVFWPVKALIVLGPLIALVIGWQEADKWKIKKLMRIFSALLVVCFIMLVPGTIDTFMHPPKVEIDPIKAAKQKHNAPRR